MSQRKGVPARDGGRRVERRHRLFERPMPVGDQPVNPPRQQRVRIALTPQTRDLDAFRGLPSHAERNTKYRRGVRGQRIGLQCMSGLSHALVETAMDAL